MTRRHVATAQGLWYTASGLLPMISMRVFERITGPKTDRWLVRMVGWLAVVIGAVLLARAVPERGRHRRDREPDPLLGIGAALAFGGVDTWYAARGRISAVYLGDAVLEAVFIAGWLLARRSPESK